MNEKQIQADMLIKIKNVESSWNRFDKAKKIKRDRRII